MTAPLKLSVIVSTYNRRQVLVSQCLPSLLNQDLPADQYEVIVIDDGSTDGTTAALHELRPSCVLRIVEQQNQGLSRSRNTGIAMAKGDLVMFIDDDIVCRADLFRRHVEAHTGTEPVVVHGALYLAPGPHTSILANANEAWYRRYNSRLAAHGGAIWPDGVFLISNSSTLRSTLLACGGFDESLPAMDDFDLGLRLWEMGVKFQYLPEAVAYELSVKSSRSFLFKDGEAFGRSEVLLCRKYPDYRPRSGLLAGMAKTPMWRQTLRRMAIQSPVSPAYLSVPLVWICEKMCRLSAMQKAGLLLLEIGRRLTEFRAALKEVGSWRSFHNEFAMRLPVLLYHHVGPSQAATLPSLTVSPSRFERQVRCLARRGFQGIRPADWLRWRREGKGIPEKPVLFTFDDGYADLAEYALPVLCRYGFGAAVFVVTGQLGGTNAWDKARSSAVHRLMTAEQIREWTERGIEFGAHGRTHADLVNLPPDRLKDEVAGSADDLEKILGARAVSFAYPYGSSSQAVVECVRENFNIAFGIDPREPGVNDLLTDPHLLRRTMVQPVDWTIDVVFRAHWGYSQLQGVRAKLRLRSRLKQAVRGLWHLTCS
jgi:peptidoglycan/xylan/chitin deacetylase (PgdA/CDA1 family)/GT2 family glycosyltransferase